MKARDHAMMDRHKNRSRIVRLILFFSVTFNLFLLWSCADDTVTIIKPIREWPTACGSISHCVLNQKQDKMLVCGFKDETTNTTVALYDTITGQQLHQFLQYNGAIAVHGLGFGWDEKKVYILRQNEILIYNAETGEPIITHTMDGYTHCVDTNLDYTVIANQKKFFESSLTVLEFYDVDTSQLRYSLSCNLLWSDTLGYSPDGRSFLVSAGNPRESAFTIDTLTGERLATLHLNNEESVDGIFSPDGNTILTQTGKRKRLMQLWEAKTGRLIHNYFTRPFYSIWSSMRFTPDGKNILWGGKPAILLQTDSGDVLLKIGDDRTASIPVAFNAEGTIAITAHSDGYVRWWDLAKGD